MKRRGATKLLAILVIFAWLCPAFAQDERAFLSLFINEGQHGEIPVIIRGDDIVAPVADLEAAGLSGFAGKRETDHGREMVSLRSLAPGVTFAFEEKDLILRITAQASLFAPTSLNLALPRPKDIEYHEDTSAFLNYSSTLNDFDGWTGFFEGGLSFKGGLLYSGLSATDSNLTRVLTNYTRDDRTDMRRYTFGDTFANSGALGGPALLGGISVAKNFSIDPYFIRYPTQQLSDILTTPSTVDVYRNGLLINRQQLAPGQFTLNNIPTQIGQGNTQVIVRDAVGNIQQINSPYYMSPQLLSQGLSDYSYGAGLLRSNLGGSSWQYGPPALTAYHRYGLTEWLTVGGRLEAMRDMESGGPLLTVGLPLGEIDSAAALSRQSGSGGAAASLAYQYIGQRVSGGASMQWVSPHYTTLNLKPSLDRPIVQALASLAFDVGYRTNIATQYSYVRFRDTGTEHLASLTATLRLTENLNLIFTATRSLPGSTSLANEVFMALSYYFGRDTVGTVSWSHIAGDQGTVSLQKPLPIGSGYGYLLQAQQGAQEQDNGFFQYQNDYDRYEADYTRVNGQNSSLLSIAGGLVAIGGRLIPTRPVQDGFALVRVPGVADVPCDWSNQEMGTTDKGGDLLIPNLLPYYGNQLSILDSSIPMNYAVDADRRTVAVPYRGGALVEFPVHRIQQVTGTVTIDRSGTRIVPALGELTLKHGKQTSTSPLGRKGEFYFQDITAGTYSASVEYASGTCQFQVVVPESESSLLKLGTVVCVAGSEGPVK
jgi:outer membrane usher protein